MNFNPLWWVHLRMTGGWAGNLLLAGGFLLGVIFFYTLSQNLIDAEDVGSLNTVWLGIITAAQSVFLLMIAPSAIRRSVLRDFQSGMIESHRLTPMSNWRIVLGYMTGPTMQAAMLLAVGFVLGTYFSAQLGTANAVGVTLTVRIWVLGWYAAIGSMLAVSLMICAFVLLTSIASSGKTNAIGAFILISIFGGWMVIFFVPGLALVLGVMSSGAMVDMILFNSGTLKVNAESAALAAILQLTLAALFLHAACGKLRRPERALFSVRQAVVLAMVWSATLVTGMAQLDTYARMLQDSEIGALAQLFASTGAFVLVATFATHAAAVDLFHADRAAAHGEPPAPGRRRQAFLVPVGMAGMTVLTLLSMIHWMAPSAWSLRIDTWASTKWPFVWIALATLLGFLTDFFWLYATAARGRKAIWSLLFLVAGLKAGPILIDAALYGMFTDNDDFPWNGWGYVTGLSPIGTIILSTSIGPRMFIGLAVQIALLAVSGMMFRAVRRTVSQPVERTESPRMAVAVG